MSNTNVPPPGPPTGGARWGVFGCLLLVVLLAIVAAVGVGGSFWGLITAGSLLVIGGIVLAIVLYRRGRPR